MSLSVLQAGGEVPDRIALVVGEREISYAQLARDVACALPALSLGAARAAASPVAIRAGLDYPSLLSCYALIEAGIPVLPISPSAPAPERARQLQLTGAVLLHPGGVGARASDKRAARLPTPPALPGSLDEERALAILFTSGSSGAPRGVELSRRAFCAAAAASAARLGWRKGDRWLLNLPWSHVGGLSILVRCLLARSTVVVAPSPRFDPGALGPLVERHRVTLLSLVPTQLQRLARLGPPWDPPIALRAILVGGAALGAPLHRELDARGWPILPTYGLTEACSQVATHPPPEPPTQSSSRTRARTPAPGSREAPAPMDAPSPAVGPPLPGVELRVVEGMIELRGPMLFSRYLDPGGAGPRRAPSEWFRTGDLGLLDRDGALHLLGRANEVIGSGGEKVAPAEVEAVLLGLPEIAAACVFGVPDEEWGECVVAAVAPSTLGPPSARVIKAQLTACLSRHKHPRRIAVLPELPLLPSGKLDRAATRQRALAQLAPL